MMTKHVGPSSCAEVTLDPEVLPRLEQACAARDIDLVRYAGGDEPEDLALWIQSLPRAISVQLDRDLRLSAWHHGEGATRRELWLGLAALTRTAWRAGAMCHASLFQRNRSKFRSAGTSDDPPPCLVQHPG